MTAVPTAPPPKDPRKYLAYGICDPGGFAKRRANFTSIPIFTAGPERRVFLVDWVLDRMEPNQRADAIVRLIRKWKPARFIYEEFGFVRDTFYLNERFEKEQIDLRMIPVGRLGPRGKMTKHERIKELQEWFREGRIWLPRSLMYRQVDGRTVDLIDYFVNHEYVPYRGPDTVPFDDALDSFSRLNDPELRLEYADPGPAREDDGDDARSAGLGTWESIF